MPKTFWESYAELVNKKLAPEQRELHVALGLCGEAGEFADATKKVFIYGQPYQTHIDNMHEELGDILFYLQAAATLHGTSLTELAHYNMEKLSARYKDEFTTVESELRNDKR